VLHAIGLLECRFGALAFRDVDEHVDGPDHASVLVANRIRMRERGNAFTVGALDEDLLAVVLATVLERECHPAFVVANRHAMPVEQLERAAPPVACMVEAWCAAPKLRGLLVEISDQTFTIARICARRQDRKSVV